MGQWLRTLSTHRMACNYLYSSSRGSYALFWCLRALHAHGTHNTLRHTQMYSKQINKIYLMCTCVHVYVCMPPACECPRRSEEGTETPGPRAIGGCKSPNVGAGSQTWLWRATVLLAIEPSLQPLHECFLLEEPVRSAIEKCSWVTQE